MTAIFKIARKGLKQEQALREKRKSTAFWLPFPGLSSHTGITNLSVLQSSKKAGSHTAFCYCCFSPDGWACAAAYPAFYTDIIILLVQCTKNAPEAHLYPVQTSLIKPFLKEAKIYTMHLKRQCKVTFNHL